MVREIQGGFMTKESAEELLREAIAASNRTTAASDRTTRAIRAFVLFFFIQLTFTSIAALFFWWGSTLTYLGSTAFIVAIGFWFLGVVLSSVAGWAELRLSGWGLTDPSEEKPFTYDYSSPATNKYPTGRSESKSSPRNDEEASEGRVCSGCVKYTTKVYCENCGDKE
jgi:hypothetical protein